MVMLWPAVHGPVGLRSLLSADGQVGLHGVLREEWGNTSYTFVLLLAPSYIFFVASGAQSPSEDPATPENAYDGYEWQESGYESNYLGNVLKQRLDVLQGHTYPVELTTCSLYARIGVSYNV